MKAAGNPEKIGAVMLVFLVGGVLCFGGAGLAVSLGAGAPGIGETIRVEGRNPAMRVGVAIEVHRLDGRSCVIGVGDSAADGGGLLVVKTGPGPAVEGIWSSKGSSSRTGPDCINGARLTMTDSAVRQLQGASYGTVSAY